MGSGAERAVTYWHDPHFYDGRRTIRVSSFCSSFQVKRLPFRRVVFFTMGKESRIAMGGQKRAVSVMIL